MHKMIMLRDNLEEELEKFADKQINEQNLDLIDKLSHAIKCIDTFVAMERSEHHDEYSGRMYHDGMSGRRYYYTQRDCGMSGMRRRDSLGRYADGYSHDEAKDRLMGEMEHMMGDVSPEAQHAIRKAINALNQE